MFFPRLFPLNDQHELLDDLGVQLFPRMEWNDKPFLAPHVDSVAPFRTDKCEAMLKQESLRLVRRQTWKLRQYSPRERL